MIYTKLLSKKFNYYLVLLLVLLNVFLIFENSFAVSEWKTKEEMCFDLLKKAIVEKKYYNMDLSILSYDNMNFTRFYKSSASYWIDLSQDLFRIRYAPFWNKSYYIHPPTLDTALPIAKRIEKWDFDVRKYLYQEEYIKWPDNKNIFQGCLITHIAGLEPILAADYWKDRDKFESGIIKSFLEDWTEVKIYFDETSSENTDWNIFVTWQRAYLYPDNKNSYFNKFAVLWDAEFNTLEDFKGFWQHREVYFELLKNSQWTSFAPESSVPREWYRVVKREWFDNFFLEASLYKKIEKYFWEFAENLKIWWLYKLDTLEKTYELNLTKEENLLQWIELISPFLDVHWLLKYDMLEKNWNKHYDFMINNINDVDNILNEVVDDFDKFSIYNKQIVYSWTNSNLIEYVDIVNEQPIILDKIVPEIEEVSMQQDEIISIDKFAYKIIITLVVVIFLIILIFYINKKLWKKNW